MLDLDYTLCDNADCPSSATCDRYQTLREHYDRLKSANTKTETIAAERSLDRVWLSNFKPDIDGRCDDYIGTPGRFAAHPPQSIDVPSE